jgi:hypothetical protein
LAGYAVETLAGPPGTSGAATVDRSYRSPELRAVAGRVAANWAITDSSRLDFIVDGPDGPFTLVGIGRALRATCTAAVRTTSIRAKRFSPR